MARFVQQKSADDLRVGDVTIYGVLLNKREHGSGYLIDYPGATIQMDVTQTIPVFCRTPKPLLESIQEAVTEERARHGRR